MIRLANHKDKEQLVKILVDVKNVEDKTNVNMWDETYPTINILENDINNNWLYTFDNNGELAGFFVINNVYDKIYDSVKISSIENSIYLHRFCTMQKYRGKVGVSEKMINFVLQIGNDNKKNIVLDTFSENIGSNKFYTKHGFIFLGDYIGRKGIYNLYEKRCN